MTEKTTYNPMSNDFKEEASRLGLTGNQLTVKYRKEGKSLKKEKVDKKKKATYNPMGNDFKEEADRLGLTGHQLTVKYMTEGKSLEKCTHKYIRLTSRRNWSYNPTNTCDKTTKIGFSWRRCGNELIPGKTYRELDKYGRETGKWICNKCLRKDNKYRCKHNHNDNTNTRKYVAYVRTGNLDINVSIIKYDIEDIEDVTRMEKERKCYTENSNKYQNKKADCRNGNLDPNSASGKGYISEVLVAKFLGIKTCFDLTGNFCYPKYDMFEHKDWGTINVKGSSLIHKDNSSYRIFATNNNKEPNFFFCIGYDENRKHVESVHIVPNGHYIHMLRSIYIPHNSNSKWDKFKESEEEIKKWDDLFHTLKLENCPVLRHDTIDISKTCNKNDDNKDEYGKFEQSANN